MKKKLNLKDYLDNDTLDLSLNDLQDVPVKEIAAFPKATSLDVSNNKIASLSRNFPISLTHLVRLDLSQNRLSELPDNFGLLVHLKHLDLYKNQLATLPLSFGSLRALRWLDLKDNPLVPKMAKVAGPCLDSTGCHAAAKSIVAFLADMQSQVEEEKRRLAEERKLQEEHDSEQSDKKETKKKKKKKSKSGEVHKPVVENGSHFVEQKENPEEIVNRTLKENPRRSAKSHGIFSKVLMVFSGLVKFVALTVVLSMLSLFMIGLLDEATYQGVKVKLSEAVKYVPTGIPRSVVELWNKTTALSAVYAKQLAENVVVLLRALLVKLQEWYVWLSTDEQVQVYVETMSHYWHAAYIKVTEFLTSAGNYLFT